jgi:hypothetical protein
MVILLLIRLLLPRLYLGVKLRYNFQPNIVLNFVIYKCL